MNRAEEFFVHTGMFLLCLTWDLPNFSSLLLATAKVALLLITQNNIFPWILNQEEIIVSYTSLSAWVCAMMGFHFPHTTTIFNCYGNLCKKCLAFVALQISLLPMCIVFENVELHNKYILPWLILSPHHFLFLNTHNQEFLLCIGCQENSKLFDQSQCC